MEIHLAAEHAFHLIPQFTLEIAHDRVEQKKASLVAGTVGALLSRPKPEDIQLVSRESRLEAFWLINAFVRTAYDRTKTDTVPVSGAEVQRVTALGQDLPVTASAKGGANVTFNGIEHCVEERRASFTFDGSGAKSDLTRYLSQPKSEISDMVLEFDAVTGEVRTDGKKFGDQLGSQLKGMVTRDLLFDVTADALGMVVPGGSIAVKLVKAVVDRK